MFFTDFWVHTHSEYPLLCHYIIKMMTWVTNSLESFVNIKKIIMQDKSDGMGPIFSKLPFTIFSTFYGLQWTFSEYLVTQSQAHIGILTYCAYYCYWRVDLKYWALSVFSQVKIQSTLYLLLDSWLSCKNTVTERVTIFVILSRVNAIMIMFLQREKQIVYISYKRRYDLK